MSAEHLLPQEGPEDGPPDGLQDGPEDVEAALVELRHRAAVTPPLAKGEEIRLVEQSARGDRDSQSRLVAANLGLVVRLADVRADRGLPVSDLIQEGSLGLVEAVSTFKDSGTVDFSAFAERKVGEQMDAALAAEGATVREAEQLIAAANDYERTSILLRRALQRSPTETEIAEKLEWSVDRTRYVAKVVDDARRRQDEELLAFIDPDAIDFDGTVDGE